jgi:hypothetical protein
MPEAELPGTKVAAIQFELPLSDDSHDPTVSQFPVAFDRK